jgi:hypothetical protein
MASGTGQLDELISTTFDKVKPVLADQITNENPLLAALNSKSRVTQDGGLTIVRPVLFGFNDTVGSYDGYDLIDTTPQDGFGNAVYDWKQYAGSVTIDGKTERLNAGSSQIIAILQAKIEQLRISIEEDLNTMLWGDGTGNSSKDFSGIQAIVSDTLDLAGFDIDADATFWKSTVTDGLDLTTIDGVRTLNHMLNTLRLAKSRPDFEFTDQEGFEAYEALAAPNLRFNDRKMADLGFESVSHKTAEVLFEDDVPANKWYMINSKYLEFVQHSGAWMEMLPFVRPANQDAKTALVISMGQLVTDVRRAHGRFDNVVSA